VRVSRQATRIAGFLTCLLCFGLPASGRGAEGPAGGTYQDWLQHRQTVLKTPGLVRYYTFEEVRTPGGEVRNLAGAGAALAYRLADPKSGEKELKQVAGRWPEKKAVRLDPGFLAGEPFDASARGMTIAAWVRVNGMGSIEGSPVRTGGPLLCSGSGVWDGWRLTFKYPEKALGFEIGRPKPSSSIGIHASPVADGIWHHLAAVWDGKEMRIQVDGHVVASAPHAAASAPPPKGGAFRIGFANSGWGSVKLDVDEVALYQRALSPAEVIRDAHYYAPLSDAVAEQFAAAARLAAEKNLAAAGDEYTKLLKADRLAPDYTALARIGLSGVRQQEMNLAQASAELGRVVEAADVAERHRQTALAALLPMVCREPGLPLAPKVYLRILAFGEVPAEQKLSIRLSLARRYREAGDLAAAYRQYKELLGLEGVPPRTQLAARLEMAHTCLAGKHFDAARAGYRQIVETAGVPVPYKSLAQLRIAESFVRQGNPGEARAEFARLAAMPDAPPHLRREAEERIHELELLAAGKPACDPLQSRVHLPKRPAPGAEFFVATDGADTNPGTKDRPFATLERARDAVRELKRRGGLPPGGVAVTLRNGEYRRTQTFQLAAEDSGTSELPVVYRAAPGETARLTGGVRLSGFQPVRNAAILARLPESVRDKVVELDLKAAGVTDLGRLAPRGYGWGPSPAIELFCNGRAMQLARWPNEGFLTVGKVLHPGKTAEKPGAVFQYEGDRPARWQQARDAWVYGYWYWHWADSTLGVASIDAQKHEITTAQVPGYGVREGQPYYFFNLLEEIDEPGEWYLDRATGTLYWYPPEDPAKAVVEMSMLNEPMARLEGVSNVVFERLEFALGRSDGVVVRGGDRCLLAGCVVKQLGGTAATLDGGTNHGVLACDLHTLGRGGTVVRGGDRKTLTPGGHFVENCHVYDFSRIDRTYTPAVLLDGVAGRIAHNLFHHSPCHAMRVEGNDHVIEFNEVHHVVTESDDQGGLDMFFNPSYRGNVLRYNFWHDIGSPQSLGQAGIRLDDAISGTLLYGNVFYRCSGANFGGVQIHGGKENVVDNNLFVECRHAISFSPWGKDRWNSFLARKETVDALTRAVDISKPPYSTRYPALARLAENPDVNMVWRNLVVGCGDFLIRDRGQQELADNYLTSQDPGFADASKLNFQLKPDAPVLDRFGLRPIPFDQIGLYPDDLRLE